MSNPRLHPNTIAEVKERVDIIDVVSDYVVLTKKGQNFFGLCPFHDEKTPSFTVSPGKQAYYCFGCGAGGGAINFLTEINKQSFTEVVFDLAQRYQIPIQTLAPEESKRIQREISVKEQIYEILALTTTFYQHALYQDEGKKALDYLIQNRRLTESTIQKFQLGYAPAGWESIFHYLIEVKHYPVNLVEKAGLIKKRNKGDGFYDQFRDRLMIPIQDQQGRIIAFGSRCLDASEPKYLNSPDTILFNKSKTLFALDKAKKKIIKEDQVIVVEGYFDAIALHEAGIENVVACLGTAFTKDHLKQLLRYSESKQVIFNFDADKAGLKATQRAIKQIDSLVYSGQVQLKILNIPEGKDADDFLKSGDDAIIKYQELVNNAPLWIDWQIEQIIVNKNLKKANEFQQVVESLIRLLNKINNVNTRNYYISYCAELLSKNKSDYLTINAEDFKQIQRTLQLAIKKQPLTKSKPNANKDLVSSIAASPEEKLLEKAEFLLLLIYLHCPEYQVKIEEEITEKNISFQISEHDYIWQKIKSIQDSFELSLDHYDSTALINSLEDIISDGHNLTKKLTSLLYLDHNQQENLFNPHEIIISAIATLDWVKYKKYYHYCNQQWLTFFNTNSEKMNYYHQELQKTKLILNNLESIRLLNS